MINSMETKERIQPQDWEEISIELKFPYTKQPDANGVIYSKEAIEKAFDKGVSNLPIVYIDNDGNESVIGCTKDEQVVLEWDDSNGVCRAKVNGMVFFAGTLCIVNEVENGVVKDFEITSEILSAKVEVK